MTRISALTLLALTCVAAPTWAQTANPANLQAPGFRPEQGRRSGNSNPRDPAPPALPGARAEPTAVAPASKSAAELPPTEALFDAVNRGDLLAAKDAVGRGADISGKNVLGLTPLELSIDLGRNEISFLLLSLRGGSGYTTNNGPAAQPAAAPNSRAERLAAQKAERAERVAKARGNVADPAPAVPQTARLFAGNGGAPIPQAGFLGFDANR